MQIALLVFPDDRETPIVLRVSEADWNAVWRLLQNWIKESEQWHLGFETVMLFSFFKRCLAANGPTRNWTHAHRAGINGTYVLYTHLNLVLSDASTQKILNAQQFLITKYK